MFKRKNSKKESSEYAIEVDDVDKSFWIPDEKVSSFKSYFLQPWKLFTHKTRRFEALNDISFKVKKGEFVGIIGRNGSGKSTLLKLIAGIYSPDKGEIKINGKLVPFLELGVGFNPDLSARENVYLNGAILGMSKKFLDKKLEEIISFAGVKKFADTPIKNFSSGMTVRLAFSIAVQAQADIYLLDEVLAVGDDAFRRKSMKKIKQLINSGVTVLYVSHDLGTVEELTDRAIWINDTRIEGDGNPSELVEEFQMSMMGKGERNAFLQAREKLKSNKAFSSFSETRDIEKITELANLSKDLGDGRAKLDNLIVLNSKGNETDSLNIDEKFKVTIKFDIHGKIDNPVITVSLRSEINRALFEMNTPVSEKNILKPLKKGDKLTVTFEAKNILNTGVYHLLFFLNDPRRHNRGTGEFASLVKSYKSIEVTDSRDPKNREWKGPIHTEYEVKTVVN